MKTRIGKLNAIGMVAVFLLLVFSVPCTNAQVIPDEDIPDENLRAQLREELGIGSTEPITQEALADLVLLDGSNSGIEGLTGLEYCVKLTHLFLNYNNINDISSLSGLTNMTNLYLSYNNINDISPLSELTSLTYLYLYYNNISDIGPLSELTSLTYLELGYNNIISNIGPLSGLTNLTHLWLAFNNISDIGPLSGLTNLTFLYLYKNQLNCYAYSTVIPLIIVNNPEIDIIHDPMPLECLNQLPVSDAGDDQIVAAGDIVYLDGTQSWDPDDDDLTFSWGVVSVPAGSLAEIANPTDEQTGFLADVVGIYELSLIVNDGTADSDPDTVTVTAISPDEAGEEVLLETEDIIQLIPPEDLCNGNALTPLTNKIEAALTMIAEGLYEDALDKLQNDILQKTDGCAEIGQPDNNDWLLTCEDQGMVYPLVMRAIELVERLI